MPLFPELSPTVDAALTEIADKDIAHVYFVACGGSLSIMHPAKFLLDQHSSALTSDVLNADEFTLRAPKALGKKSLVVLCSMTGTTKETVRAAEFARARGAYTVGLTNDTSSPLATACHVPIQYESLYTTGERIDSRDSNYGRIYELVMGLVKLKDGEDKIAPLVDSLNNLQAVIDRAIATLEPMFEDFAPRFAKEDMIYTIASGADFGASYSHAICVLMEMQWINSHPLHANEFFHGPFEVVDPDQAFILFQGLDSTRPLETRARTFLERFGSGEKVMILDAEALDLTGLHQEFAGNLVPLVFFDALWHFAYKLAALRKHEMLTDRRYMKKLSDY